MNCYYQELGWERIHCYYHTGFNNPNLIALKYSPPGKETQIAKITGKKTAEYCGYLRKIVFIRIYICLRGALRHNHSGNVYTQVTHQGKGNQHI